MRIRDLSAIINSRLVTIPPESTALNAATLLKQHNIGALPVCGSSGDLIGIISERDIVHALSENTRELDGLKVKDLMTSDVIRCNPDDDVNEIMAIMEENHIRHIPVMTAGHLSSMISSRDVMVAVLGETKAHVQTLGLAYEMVR